MSAPELMEPAVGGKTPMRPIGLALQLIEGVAELQPIGASEIARRLGLPKATAHRILLALETYGWLERDGGNRPLWSVSMTPISIAGRAIERKSGLRIAALSVMDDLRRSTDETVHLGLLDGDSMVLLERVDGMRSVSTFLPVGTSWGLHWSSAGKAVLARLPADRQSAYMSKPLIRRKTTTDILPPEELKLELESVRERGFAMSVGSMPGSASSVGAAIYDKSGFPFAGLSISGASERLKAEQLLELAPKVVEAARRISMGVSMD